LELDTLDISQQRCLHKEGINLRVGKSKRAHDLLHGIMAPYDL
jgi:hypothetical protein